MDGGSDETTVLPDLSARTRHLNRELSWLQFNARVLEQGAGVGLPLLERLKFIAIVSGNLDEFFQVRVAGLRAQVEAGVRERSPDGRTAAVTLAEVRKAVDVLVKRQEDLLNDDVLPALAGAGIRIRTWAELDTAERKYLGAYFDERVFPVLTPLVVDPGHPFPYISNLALNLGILATDPVTSQQRFARVKLPSFLPRFVPLAQPDTFVAMEEVIGNQLATLFPGMRIDEWAPFRVTRDADLLVQEDEADDLLEAVELELRRRRFGEPVRLEVAQSMTAGMRATLVEELELEPRDMTEHRGLLGLSGLWALYSAGPAHLRDEPWARAVPPALAALPERSVFAVLREREVMLHHPYESFTRSVEAFVEAAASDPLVRSIKMTLYRTSGESPIARSLIRAAERGVQVAVLIELKARFDEQANVAWARELERAGVHVVYGLVGLKTHAKCVLVVREETNGLRRYVHIGTGNYNSRTARIYEDIGMLSADPELAADVGDVFNHLTGFSRQHSYRRVIVAPSQMRGRLIELIENEQRCGTEGSITIKVNGLSDPAIIEALYAASAAGVPIDLIVRGICTLRARVAGLSETIRVRSILGRYLEHSRVMRFGHGSADGGPLVLIGSADLMQRNLDRRVELLVPLHEEAQHQRINRWLTLLLDDDVACWELLDDSWTRRGDRDVQASIRALT